MYRNVARQWTSTPVDDARALHHHHRGRGRERRTLSVMCHKRVSLPFADGACVEFHSQYERVVDDSLQNETTGTISVHNMVRSCDILTWVQKTDIECWQSRVAEVLLSRTMSQIDVEFRSHCELMSFESGTALAETRATV